MEDIQNGGVQESDNTNYTITKSDKIDDAIDTDILLKEDMVLQYLELIEPEDRYLLDLEKIQKTGEKYIDNLQGSIYPKYRDQLRNIVARYSNRKKYQIRATKTYIGVFKMDGINTNAKKGEKDKQIANIDSKAIEKVEKPIFMDLESVLLKGRGATQSQRAGTRMQYNHLLSKTYLDEKDKVKFNKQREKYIATLNAYYSVQYYANKINKYIVTNKAVAVPVLVDYKQQNVKKALPRINSVYINLDPMFIESMFHEEGEKLELYNKIIELQSTLDSNNKEAVKELNALIKTYITYDRINDTMKTINKKLKKLKEFKQENILVVDSTSDRPDFCKHSLSFTIYNKSSSKLNNNSNSNNNSNNNTK